METQPLSLPYPAAPSLPAEPAARPKLPSRWRAALAAVALVPGIVAGGLFVKVDAHALSPGPAEDVGRLIRVKGTQYASKGAFLLTTVSVTIDTINLFEAVRAWVDPAIETIPREALVGRGLTDDQQDQLNQADMEESKYNAIVVAAQALNLDVSLIPGARVVKVFAGLPAEGILKEGDVIVAVGGTSVASVTEMSSAIRQKPPGAELPFDVLRSGERKSFTIRTVADSGEPSRAIIGIRPAPAYSLPFDVIIDSQDIVGPSAGLMFALAIADSLTESDLTRGHRIAGTGTISLDGMVGPIGGVGQKVRAAEHAGAEIFLSPPEDFAAAKATAGKIRVYAVRTIGDAVKLLESLPVARSN